MTAKHPMQPVVFDKHRVARFKANPIIRHLVDKYPNGLNSLTIDCKATAEDWSQLYLLIGYSVGGFGDLSGVPQSHVTKADAEVAQQIEERKALKELRKP